MTLRVGRAHTESAKYRCPRLSSSLPQADNLSPVTERVRNKDALPVLQFFLTLSSSVSPQKLLLYGHTMLQVGPVLILFRAYLLVAHDLKIQPLFIPISQFRSASSRHWHRGFSRPIPSQQITVEAHDRSFSSSPLWMCVPSRMTFSRGLRSLRLISLRLSTG